MQAAQLNLRTPTLADQVAEAILGAILAGQLTRNQRLTTEEVAEWLGVSRTPVREAFLILHRQNLLHKDTSRSFVVGHWTKKDLLELAQLRACLESLAVELAISRISPEDLDLLESIAMQMESALNRGHPERLVLLDSQFHNVLWRIAGNKRLLQVLEDLGAQIRYFMHITRPWEEINYATQHRDLIAALQSGDAEKAKSELREHILSTAMRVIATLDESAFAG